MINRNQRKRKFLEWLLVNYQHENPIVNKWLTYLAKQPNYINYFVFTDQIEKNDFGIFVSFDEGDSNNFIYYKNQHQYNNPEQLFHDLRLNAEFYKKNFYVEIKIPDYYQKAYLFDVFEENPLYDSAASVSSIVEENLQKIASDSYRKQVERQINSALESRDFDRLEVLRQEYTTIKGKSYED